MLAEDHAEHVTIIDPYCSFNKENELLLKKLWFVTKKPLDFHRLPTRS